jgi:hypothetical protein
MDRRIFLTTAGAAMAFLLPVIASRTPLAHWLSASAGETPDIYDGAPWTAGDLEDLKSELEHCGSIQDAAKLLCRSGTVEDVAQKSRKLGLRPAKPMTVYAAHNNDTRAEMLVADFGGGAGRTKCFECGGDGNWGKFAPGMVPPDMKCPNCKGSGWLLVSV